jgi:hypothetical protein
MDPMSQTVSTDTAGNREPTRLDLYSPCHEIVGYKEQKKT